jgi:hypothetical protein
MSRSESFIIIATEPIELDSERCVVLGVDMQSGILFNDFEKVAQYLNTARFL